jgi:hypothetical protein
MKQTDRDLQSGKGMYLGKLYEIVGENIQTLRERSLPEDGMKGLDLGQERIGVAPEGLTMGMMGPARNRGRLW